MEAVANNPAFAKKVGIKQSVGKDFAAADKGKKFKAGGCTKMKEGGMASNLFKGKETYGEELKEAKAIKSGKITPAEYAKGEGKEEKKMAKGGIAEAMGPKNMKKDVETGSNKLKKFGESAVQKRGDTKGKNFGDSGPTRMASGGVTRADGCAQRGKTKGRYL